MFRRWVMQTEKSRPVLCSLSTPVQKHHKKNRNRKTSFVAEYCGTEGPHRYVTWWVNIAETPNLATCSSKEKALSSQTELLKLLCRCALLSITWPDQSLFWTDGFSTSGCLLDYRPTQSISPSVWTSRLSVESSAVAVQSALLLLTITRDVVTLLTKLVNNNIALRTHRKFYIRGSVHRNSRLRKSNEMQQYADIYLYGHVWRSLLPI